MQNPQFMANLKLRLRKWPILLPFLLGILLVSMFQNCGQPFKVTNSSQNLAQQEPPDIANQRTCTDSGKQGTQIWSGTTWTTCKICQGGYTSWEGACFPNPTLAAEYTSYLSDCWQDGVIHCPSKPFMGYIQVPSKYAARVNDTIVFPIKYTGANSVTLSSDHITLLGSATTGCTKTVSGSGSDTRTVTVSGCSGVGTLRISIAAGSARSSTGQELGSFGPSSDVMISNTDSITKSPIIENFVGSYPGTTGAQIPFAMYYPSDYANRRNIPVLIWIHGGGWTGGDYTIDAQTGKDIAELGFVVINANYTLATINPANSPTNYFEIIPPITHYSAGPDDIKALIKYVVDNVHLMNGDKNNISISGSSAGGHLALHQATRPDNTTQFKCVISMAGPTDLVAARIISNYPISNYIVGTVFGNSNSVLQSYSAAYNTATLKANKLAIVHQLQDNLVPIDQALQLAAKLKTNKPSVEVTLNYANETNPFPVFNPTPSQVTHVYDNSQLNRDALKAYVYSHCR